MATYILTNVVSQSPDLTVTRNADGSFTLTHPYGVDTLLPDLTGTYQRNELYKALPQAEYYKNADGSPKLDAKGEILYIPQTSYPLIYTLANPANLTQTARVNYSWNIVGADDAPTITGTTSGAIFEDAVTLTVTGTVNVVDPDLKNGVAYQNGTVAATGLKGTYGSLSIDASGHWTYTLNNSAANVQSLPAGVKVTDVINVTAGDGKTPIPITVTITGVNDIATVSSATGKLTEGQTTILNGKLTVVDVDAGEAIVGKVNGTTVSGDTTIKGTYGTLHLQPDGTWTYQLDNSLAAVKDLRAGATADETFNVVSKDGTGTGKITITISGIDQTVSINDGKAVFTEDAQPFVQSGKLVGTDASGNAVVFPAGTQDSIYGTFVLKADGSWTYTLKNDSDAVQSLAQGDVRTEKYTITSGEVTTTVNITINGVNDVPTITGTSTATVTENNGAATPVTAEGTLTVVDKDHDQSGTTAGNYQGQYGTIALDAKGHWVYTLDNKRPDVVALLNGQKLTDTVVVRTLDGTEKPITITINGTSTGVTVNDGKVTLVEDSNNYVGTGKLAGNDANGQALVFPAGTKTSDYGTFTVDAAGNWRYVLNNSADKVQALPKDATITETYDLTTTAGIKTQVVVTVVGVNDAPTITGTATGTVIEDTTLSTSGKLTVVDKDTGESALIPGTTAGTYGSLVLQADGSWVYTLDNAKAQPLQQDETKTEVFKVHTVDGTETTITVTVKGVNDVPTITGTTTSSVTENNNTGVVTTTGTLTVVDKDHDQSGTTAGTYTGTYGKVVVDGSGHWTYTLDQSKPGVTSLNTGDKLTDTIKIKTTDGTEQAITITINGDTSLTVVDQATLNAHPTVGVEDTTLALAWNLFGVTGSGTPSIKVTSLPADGVLQFNGHNVTVGETISKTDIDAGKLVFKPDANESGIAAFNAPGVGNEKNDYAQFRFQGVEGTATTAERTATIDIKPVTDQPTWGPVNQTVTVTTQSANTHGHVNYFENLNDGEAQGWRAYSSATPNVTARTEILPETYYGASDPSRKVLEVESDPGVNTLGRTFATKAGATYTFELDYSARAGVTEGTNSELTVLVNGKSIGVMNTHTVNWSHHSFTFQGSGSDLIELRSTDANAQGGIVDNIALTSNAAYSSGLVREVWTGLNIPVSAGGVGADLNVVENAVESAGAANRTQNITDLSLASVPAGETSRVTGLIYLEKGHTYTFTGAADDSFRLEVGGVTTVASATYGTNGGRFSGTFTPTEDAWHTLTVFHRNESGPGSLDVNVSVDGGAAKDLNASNFALAKNLADLTSAGIQVSALQENASGEGGYYVSQKTSSTTTVTVVSDGTQPIEITTLENIPQDIPKLTPKFFDNDGSEVEKIFIKGLPAGFRLVDGQGHGYTITEANAAAGVPVYSNKGSASGNWDLSTLEVIPAKDFVGTVNAIAVATSQDVGDVEKHADLPIKLTWTPVDVVTLGTPAVITGTATGTVVEDTTLSTSGKLVVTDPDAGQAALIPGTQTGAYGSLVLQADGTWKYDLDNAKAQPLQQNETKTEVFQVHSVDGTESTITVTVKGVNDVPTITGTTTQTVTENNNTGVVTTTGKITVVDADHDQSGVTAGTYTGAYGKIIFGADGTWTYTLDQSKPAVTGLNDGQHLTDTITYRTLDGTQETITVNINGKSLPDTAAINGLVFKDLNDNGIRDTNDTGIAAVGVELRDAAGKLVATTTTDASGAYHFGNLAAGQYVVDFVQSSAALSGLKLVAANQGTDPTHNSDVTNIAANSTSVLALAQGQTLNNIDAGYAPPQVGTVSGTVWNDTNGDGIRQAGEAGIAGATVDLRIAGGTTSVGTTTTDANGNYSFTNVKAGNYFVDFAEDKAPLLGKTFSAANQGSDDSKDSDVTNATAGWTGNFALAAGGAVEHVDAGINTSRTSAITGLVFKDLNDNGIRDTNDTGIAAVGVELRQPDGTLVARTTTDASGAYSFTSLAAGQYVVDFVEGSAALNGLKLVAANQGSDATRNSDASNTDWNATGVLNLAQGQTLSNIDAGYAPPQKGTVSGTVWNDTNNDGIHQAGEAGIAGVVVDLRIAGGTTSVGQTTTDANGNYVFNNVTPGNYFVDFAEDKAPLVGRSFASALQGSDRSVDSDVTNYTAGWTGNFAVASGGSVEHIDAGIRPVPVASSVSGSVWNDTNNDGIRQAGEAGIAGVTVDLRIAGTRTSVGTTTTDANGNYTFSNVKEGSYFVDFAEDKAPLIGRSFTAAHQGSNTAVDSDVTNAQIGFTDDFTLKTGQSVEHIDAGIRPASSVSGSVWNDTNNDGIRQAGEAGIAGVTVDLRVAGTINSVATVTTDANGNYVFNNVKEGNYFVDFAEDKAPLIGRNFASGLQGSDRNVDSDVTNYVAGWTHDISVTSGNSVQHIDAGIRPILPNSVSGLVWLDSDNDRQFTAGEKGIAGVTAVLYATDDAGNAMNKVVATTTTDADGRYTFTNVPAGRYFVDFNESQLPSGARFYGGGASEIRDSSNSGWSSPFTLAQGQQVSIDAAASNVPQFGTIITKSSTPLGWGAYVELKDAVTQQVVRHYDYPNNTSNYTFNDVPPGQYYLIVRAAGMLAGGDIVDRWASSGAFYNTGSTAVFTVEGGQTYTKLFNAQSPIAIDLNEDGLINTVGVEHAGDHKFDLLGTGDKVKSGWLAKGDGFLVIDTNHNGKIDNVNEMFGGAIGQGFAKLAKFDTNGDGYINVQDKDFGELKVWVDANGDRITDPGELKTLAEVGIVAIKVGYEIAPGSDGTGNVVIEKSYAIRADGSHVLLGDVYFQLDSDNLSQANVDALANQAAASAEAVASLTEAERAAIGLAQSAALSGAQLEHGTSGSDVFAINLDSNGHLHAGTALLVKGFGTASIADGGDALDLRNVVNLKDGAAHSDYVSFEAVKDGSGTVVHIMSNGDGVETAAVLLQGVDLTAGGTLSDSAIVSQLENTGKLFLSGGKGVEVVSDSVATTPDASATDASTAVDTHHTALVDHGQALLADVLDIALGHAGADKAAADTSSLKGLLQAGESLHLADLLPTASNGQVDLTALLGGLPTGTTASDVSHAVQTVTTALADSSNSLHTVVTDALGALGGDPQQLVAELTRLGDQLKTQQQHS
ncbi:VCBS domain-containing protein [Amphibiibacter pelophylacis]|uniref:VCBS domain-containing protein n=1 Tax=Amphibiibacter pelophylacis TaxID=1799477 RepID=A0ACC6P2N1_9BURK